MTENKSIERLLRSIFNQTNQNFEVIVIDNCSRDKTKEICEKFPITFIEQESTISKAWNIGLERAKGKYILFIDSDMELPPAFLEECYNVVKSGSVDCIKFDANYVASKTPTFFNIAKPRNLERELGGAPLNIYFYSIDIIGETRYPESSSPIVGEEYIFRGQILEKNPRIASVTTKVTHYYDPSLGWLARRSWKYGKWYVETEKHLTARQGLEFIRYNSVIKHEFLSTFGKLICKEPSIIFSFLLYISVKYASFTFGYLDNKL
jgi:glycosyltransferase involved in cell wall biosynthesis